MKVNIYETVEVSDEQRKKIAKLKDGPDAKTRQATRDELKEFIWAEGSDWASILERDVQLNGDAPAPEAIHGDNTEVEDLI